jgi:hypothetical protein
MIDHEAIKNILPGLDLIDEIPNDTLQDIFLTRDYVEPVISILSTHELTKSVSTLIYGVLLDIVTEDSHPGIYLHLWNQSMALLSSLKIIKNCDGLEDFLPNTAFQRNISSGQLIVEQWLGSSQEFCSTSSIPEKNSHQFSLEQGIADLRDYALYHLLSAQYLSAAENDILMFLCEEIMANSLHDSH